MQNIACYVLDHTTRDVGRWLTADEQGPYFVSALYAPRKTEFLRLARLHIETSPACNPFDGREHTVGEIARWIRNRALAVRFVGLGVILGIFELAEPSDAQTTVNREETSEELEKMVQARFRLKGSRHRKAIGPSTYDAGLSQARRQPGLRTPRYMRCRRTRTSGINRAGAM
jgi:hypothetical protein